MRTVGILKRAVIAVVRAQSAQIALQERYLQRQRPWEKRQIAVQEDWLQWTGTRLAGSVVPPEKQVGSGRIRS